MTTTVTTAFLPLIDASILIAAREFGFAEAHDIDLILVRETSWANVRDRIAIGHFDAAHMLAPMPIASNLGITPFDVEIIAPMALGLGGNAITISKRLRSAAGLSDTVMDPLAAGQALRLYLQSIGDNPESKPRIGVVHPHSAHNLELRYWLSGSGINPDKDCEIVILPPSLMRDALYNGKIDAFCVGEPWNSVATATTQGTILTTKNMIWASSPEKVLGVHAEWARKHAGALKSLIHALHEAAKWCSEEDNKEKLAPLLASDVYLGIDERIIRQALTGPAGYEPYQRAATFPWQSHAMWFYTQMVRWGMIEHTKAKLDHARRTYRPDIYRAALRDTDAVVPTSSMKVEGALTEAQPVGATGGKLILGPDGFFDRKIFDPDHVEAYIDGQKAG